MSKGVFSSFSQNLYCGNQMYFQNRSYARRDNFGGANQEGFLRTFLRKLKENMKNDESIRGSVEELEESVVTESVKEGLKMTQEGSKWIREQTEPLRDEVSRAAEKTGKALYTTVDTIGKGVDTVADNIVVKSLLDELNREYRQLLEAQFSFRSEYGRKEDLERGVYYNPYSKQFESLEDMVIDDEFVGISIVDGEGLNTEGEGELVESEGGLFSSARTFVANVGDRFFGGNVHAEALAQIRERNPDFNMDIFVGNVENLLIPHLLESYFNDDKEELQRYLSKEAYIQFIWPQIQEREEEGIHFETKVINISDTSFIEATFSDRSPQITLVSLVQYIHCLVDDDGNVVEGGRNDIRRAVHGFSFIQDPTGETQDWEVSLWEFGAGQALAA